MYERLQPNINYVAKGKVLNNQAPAGNAVERRNHVREMLRKAYGDQLDAERYGKEEFYKLINNASAIVCVPGARNVSVTGLLLFIWAIPPCGCT